MIKSDREDDVLRQLGRLAAEDDLLSADDQELELLCAGELPEDRLRLLEARARRDAELAMRLAAYRPLDATSRSRIAEAVLREVGAAIGGASARAGGDALERSGRVRIRARLPSARSWGWVTAAAAVAAAIVIGIGHRPTTKPAMSFLPTYAVDVTGGERELRDPSAPAGPTIRLRPESRLDLVLRPATAVPGPIAVEAFLAHADTIEPLPIRFEISPSGAARMAGTAAELFGSRRGQWQLRLIVERFDAARGEGLSRARGEDVAKADARRADVDLWLLDAH